MTDDATPRLAMPLLLPEQAQKEMFHNEALAVLDLLVQGAVEAVGVDEPPAAAIGQCWIVGETPAGAWVGQAGAVACLTAGGWRFAAPFAGLQLWSRADGCEARFDGAAWRIGDLRGQRVVIDEVQVLGRRGAAIADPSGGATIDAEARDSIAAILTILRNHGLIAS